MNLPSLRNSYESFVTYTFSKRSIAAGFDFGSYGPGDQGAYGSFYKNKIAFQLRSRPFFNWKVYWDPDEARDLISLVHFHGPKPLDLMLHFNGSKPNALFSKMLGTNKCLPSDTFNRCSRWVEIWKSIFIEIDSH